METSQTKDKWKTLSSSPQTRGYSLSESRKRLRNNMANEGGLVLAVPYGSIKDFDKFQFAVVSRAGNNKR